MLTGAIYTPDRKYKKRTYARLPQKNSYTRQTDPTQRDATLTNERRTDTRYINTRQKPKTQTDTS